jgi:predicted O-methyltransferase YrrM
MSLTNPDAPLYAYLLDHQPPEHAALRALREATREMERAFMQISIDQGHFMALLLKLIRARRVLEIGTFTGYSALAMALALPRDGRVITCDINDEWVSIGRRYWEAAGAAGRIEVRLGPALETFAALESSSGRESFDAVFIDADKDNYGGYYEASLRLVRRGGLIIVDNVLRFGRVIDADDLDAATVAIRELNNRIASDERVDCVMLPIGDGVTLVRRR